MATRLLCVLLLALGVSVSSDAQTRARLRFTADPGCAGCIEIETTDVAQDIIDMSPEGSTFLFKSGIHREDMITARDHDVFFGEYGAILNGSKVLANGSFTTSGGFWKIGGQTQTIQARVGFCQYTFADGYMGAVAWANSYKGCNFAEELFYDSTPLTRVETLAEMGPGEWFWDDAANEVHVGTDPAGHLIELSTTPRAFTSDGNWVTVDGLTIEKYTNEAQYGCVDVENTFFWSVTRVTIQLCHGGAIRVGHGLFFANSYVLRNGQEGIVGIGDEMVIENVEVAYNNRAHFDPGWEAGGSKFVLTNQLIVRNCWFHHNEGPGLWGDIDNFDAILTGNRVEDNDQMGIFWEISWRVRIENNTVRRNGLAYWVPGYIWGVGILNAASKDVEIHGNIVEGNRGGIAGVQQSRGSGTYGEHLIQNFNVHDNTVTIDVNVGGPTWNGLVDDTGSGTIFTSDNNTFTNNDYFLKANTDYFVWANAGDRSFAVWSGTYGHDTTGSATIY